MGILDKAKQLISGEEKDEGEKHFNEEVKQMVEEKVAPEPKAPEDVSGFEEETPTRHANLELEDIAKILDVKDKAKFCELFDTDLPAWKELLDNAAHIKIMAMEDFMARMGVVEKEDEETETLHAKASKVAKIVVRLNNLDAKDKDAVRELRHDARDLDEDANMVSKNSGDNEEVMTSYLGILNAHRCGLELYVEAIEERNKLLELDNFALYKLAKVPEIKKAMDAIIVAYKDAES